MDCFLSKTIPIYYGCPNIGEFFNSDGVLSFGNIDELDVILKTINEDMYTELSGVIEENYLKAKEYTNLYERVDNTVKEFILNK